MGTGVTREDLGKLLKEFAPSEIEWRLAQAGIKAGKWWAKAVPYLTASAVQGRLDDVVGPENWSVKYREWRDGAGQVCQLSIRVGDDWVTKEDGAQDTHIEAVKGGISDSFKRAARAWGIGRYLCGLGEFFVDILPDGERGKNFSKIEADGQRRNIHWNDPVIRHASGGIRPAEKPEAESFRDTIKKRLSVVGTSVEALAKAMHKTLESGTFTPEKVDVVREIAVEMACKLLRSESTRDGLEGKWRYLRDYKSGNEAVTVFTEDDMKKITAACTARAKEIDGGAK